MCRHSHVPFSYDEDRLLITYVLLQREYAYCAGNKLWEEAEKQGLCANLEKTSRSWQSMRGRWYTKLQEEVDWACLDVPDIISRCLLILKRVPRNMREEFNQARKTFLSENRDLLSTQLQALVDKDLGIGCQAEGIFALFYTRLCLLHLF